MTELRGRWRTFAILQDKHSINFLFKEIIAELKQAIVNAWQQLSQAFIDTSINEWCHRFSCVIRLITTNILTVHVVSVLQACFHHHQHHCFHLRHLHHLHLSSSRKITTVISNTRHQPPRTPSATRLRVNYGQWCNCVTEQCWYCGVGRRRWFSIRRMAMCVFENVTLKP